MPDDGLKYVHVCSEGKTLGKILQSLVDMRGDIGDNGKEIGKLNKNVDELNKQINNGVSSTITKLKKRVDDIESGERPTTPDGKLKDRRATAEKVITRLSKAQKYTIGIALIPVIFVYGVWLLKGVGIAVDFLIKVWPK